MSPAHRQCHPHSTMPMTSTSVEEELDTPIDAPTSRPSRKGKELRKHTSLTRHQRSASTTIGTTRGNSVLTPEGADFSPDPEIYKEAMASLRKDESGDGPRTGVRRGCSSLGRLQSAKGEEVGRHSKSRSGPRRDELAGRSTHPTRVLRGLVCFVSLTCAADAFLTSS